MLGGRLIRGKAAPKAVILRAPRTHTMRLAIAKPQLQVPRTLQINLAQRRAAVACSALSWADPDLKLDHDGIGQIGGIQSFVASLKDRRSHVPPEYYKNPLQRLFQRFDDDSDGYLSAKQVYLALASNNIDITEEQTTAFVDAADLQLPGLQLIGFEEFEAIVYKMAEVDLANNGLYLKW